MSAVPDLLLQPAAKTKARAAPAKAPNATQPGSQRKAPDFAQVYARERQQKPVERAEPVAKGARERFCGCADDAPVTDSQVNQEPLAESGNSLPVEEAADTEVAAVVASTPADEPLAPETQLDPLMLLALSGQLPAEASATSTPLAQEAMTTQTAAEPAAVTPALTGGVASAGVATMTDASHDATLDTLTSAAGVQLVVDLATKAQLAAQAAAQQGSASQGATDAAQEFSGVVAGVTQQLQAKVETEAELGDAVLTTLEELGGETRKEAAPELRSEQLNARLSTLSQAIGQSSPAASRLSLLPGQPLALQQGGWSEAVVDKVMWLSSQNLKSAEIQLDPADLGRLEVRVDMAKDQTQVTFASPHAGVRETLEGQMQRLRDLFTQQGMNLLDVNVSDQSLSRGWQGQEQSQGGNGAHRGNGAGGLLASGEDERLTAVTELRGRSSASPRGLVDYYA